MPAQLERPNHALCADVGDADALHQADLADRARTHAACANEADLDGPAPLGPAIQCLLKALTDLIMKRVWKPGDLIPSEKELAIRFQVGRSTIREAVKSLVVLGVLEAREGEGSFVREPTSELLSGGFRWGLLLSEGNLDDFVDVRVLIEVECARRAAATKQRSSFRNSIQPSTRCGQSRWTTARSWTAIPRFHLAIAHAARNPIFETVGSTIQSIVRIWYPKTYYIPETKGRTIAEHHAIANGVASGDMDAAGQAMRAHLVAAGHRLRTLLPSRET